MVKYMYKASILFFHMIINIIITMTIFDLFPDPLFNIFSFLLTNQITKTSVCIL